MADIYAVVEHNQASHTIAASTGQGGTWANRTEVLWSNRPLGVQLALDLSRAAPVEEVAGA